MVVGLNVSPPAPYQSRPDPLRLTVPGVRKKPTKQMVQKRLKKHLTPKNATVALQEACPGAKYNFSLVPASSPPFYTAEVEV